MRLTPNQIEELLLVLDKYTWTFLAHHVGLEVLTTDQKFLLQRSGVSLQNLTRASYNIEHGFKFGIISESLGEAVSKGMNYSQLKAYLESGKFSGLSKLESDALQSIKYQTATDINKLGQRVKDDIRNKFVQVDRVKNTIRHNAAITNMAKKALEDKKYVREMMSLIGESTGKWNNDLGRISDYVLHEAFDQGRLAGAVREKGDDALVYKDVYPGACPQCIKAFLIGGAGSQPLLFKASELKANGTNVGRKQADWKPVVGPLHPWCRCTTQQAPDGITIQALQQGKWEWSGTVFRRVKQKEERRKRSKVKVTIGNKTIEV